MFQQCQRICLFSLIAEECNCMHPLYTDFDDLRKMKIERNNTSEMKVCNLIENRFQRGKYCALDLIKYISCMKYLIH